MQQQPKFETWIGYSQLEQVIPCHLTGCIKSLMVITIKDTPYFIESQVVISTSPSIFNGITVELLGDFNQFLGITTLWGDLDAQCCIT